MQNYHFTFFLKINEDDEKKLDGHDEMLYEIVLS